MRYNKYIYIQHLKCKAAQHVITTDRSKSADKTGWDSGKEISVCPKAPSSRLPATSFTSDQRWKRCKRKQDHCDLSLFSKNRTFWSLFESPGCIICEFKTYIWVKWEFSVLRPGDWRLQLKMRGGENPVKRWCFLALGYTWTANILYILQSYVWGEGGEEGEKH